MWFENKERCRAGHHENYERCPFCPSRDSDLVIKHLSVVDMGLALPDAPLADKLAAYMKLRTKPMEKSLMGDRFKRYEVATDMPLSRRTPVIGRIDGRAFHTLTRGMKKPFDWDFAEAMTKTAVTLLEEIQGAQLAYIQSDEINLLLVDYQTIQTEAWFDYRLQKMASIAGSVASVRFTHAIKDYWPGKIGHFDARFFNVPANDVCNYFVWRQRDAKRNSLQSLAQATFSHKSLQGLNSSDLQEKLFSEANINYNDLDPMQKRGIFVVKDGEGWTPTHAPIFSQDRNSVEQFLPEYNGALAAPVAATTSNS